MSDDVLFEIKKENLDTGLRGYPVGYCTTSTVDPQKGLFYAGQPVDELSFDTPEEVIYLLYKGKKGSKDELEAFKKDLSKRSHIKKEALDAIEKLPKAGHPMALFSCAILVLGMFEGLENYTEDCLNLIAKLPQLTATVLNHHAGWGKTPEPKPDLGHVDNFTYMLQCPVKDKKALNDVFKLFTILHFDHGGGNLSTFIGKAIASGHEDMYGALSGAMSALAGPLHGRANQECLEFVEEILKELGENTDAAHVEELLKRKLKNKELVYGFGHAVLRMEDPRAKVIYDYVDKHYPQNPLVKITRLLRTEGTKVLKENPSIQDPYPNVDAISGTLLSAAGFHYPEYFTILFGFSRAVGIAIQIEDDRLHAREGKGTPIVRPKYIYKPRTS